MLLATDVHIFLFNMVTVPVEITSLCFVSTRLENLSDRLRSLVKCIAAALLGSILLQAKESSCICVQFTATYYSDKM